MDFSREAKLDTEQFNRLLWHAFKGEKTPYPTQRTGHNLSGKHQTLLSQRDPD